MTLTCTYCNLINKPSVTPPKIKKELKRKVNLSLLEYFNNSITCKNNKEKFNLGALYFSSNNKIYIHCPIKKVSSNGLIKFGNCKHFFPLENNFRNRQKLCTHKFRYHFKCDKYKSSKIQLKVSRSVEEVVKYIE